MNPLVSAVAGGPSAAALTIAVFPRKSARGIIHSR